MLRELTWESSLAALAFELKQELVIMREANKAGDDFIYAVMSFIDRFDYGAGGARSAEDRLAQDIFLLEENIAELRSKMEGRWSVRAYTMYCSLHNLEKKLKAVLAPQPSVYMKTLCSLLALHAWIYKDTYAPNSELFDSYKKHLAHPEVQDYLELQSSAQSMLLKLKQELARNEARDHELLEGLFKLEEELTVQALIQGWE